MSARWLAIALVLVLVPAVELAQQGVHAVEHALAGEEPGHDAHHEDRDAHDEHGCTQLVHVCGCHQGLGLTPIRITPPTAERSARATAPPREPRDLDDLSGHEPPYRPPIA